MVAIADRAGRTSRASISTEPPGIPVSKEHPQEVPIP
jgi:hypothetical protein